MGSEKADRRVQYTKRALRGALVDLMAERPVSKISVKALCEAADINRSTFYAHYRNQYDLLEHVEREVLEEIEAFLREGSPRVSNVVRILEYARANAALFIVLLDEGDLDFQKQIMELARLADLRLADHENDACATVEYMHLYAVNGALGMLIHWLRKGTPQPPQEMAELLMRMIQSSMEEAAR